MNEAVLRKKRFIAAAVLLAVLIMAAGWLLRAVVLEPSEGGMLSGKRAMIDATTDPEP